VDYETICDQYCHFNWALDSRTMDDALRRIDDLGLDYLSIDATQDALAIWGADPNDNRDVASWFRGCPQRIVEETGVTVFIHDHHGWANKTRPMGATSKLVNVTTSWNLSVEERFSRDEVGAIRLALGQKNRTGFAPLEHLFKIGGTPMEFERKSDAEVKALHREQEQLVRHFLEVNGPHSGKQLEDDREKVGVSRDGVRDAVKRLLKKQLILREGKKLAWNDPTAGIEIIDSENPTNATSRDGHPRGPARSDSDDQ
jgi:hypothetical protein